MALWYFTRDATIALIITILIDGAGGLLTLVKSYEHPETETLSSWALTSLGGLFGMFAVGKCDAMLLAWPTYICLMTLAITVAIVMKRYLLRKNF